VRGPLERVGQDVDDDELLAGLDELSRDCRADAPVAAQDVVVAELGHGFGHPSRLPSLTRRFGDHRLGHDSDAAVDDADPADREKHGPDPLRHSDQLADLAESNGGHRDHGHVDRIGGAPREEDDIADRTDDHRRQHDPDPEPNVAALDDLERIPDRSDPRPRTGGSQASETLARGPWIVDRCDRVLDHGGRVRHAPQCRRALPRSDAIPCGAGAALRRPRRRPVRARASQPARSRGAGRRSTKPCHRPSTGR